MKFRESYGTAPGVDVGVGISKMLKFYVKVFYVMGKALTGKLSCLVTALVLKALSVEHFRAYQGG